MQIDVAHHLGHNKKAVTLYIPKGFAKPLCVREIMIRKWFNRSPVYVNVVDVCTWEFSNNAGKKETQSWFNADGSIKGRFRSRVIKTIKRLARG